MAKHLPVFTGRSCSCYIDNQTMSNEWTELIRSDVLPANTSVITLTKSHANYNSRGVSVYSLTKNMLKQVKLKAIYINEKDQQGNQLTNKKGGLYKMVVIENEEGKKASMYVGQFNGAWDKKLDVVSQWKAGDVVKIEIEQNGQYLNFSLPTKTDELSEQLTQLEKRVRVLESHLKPLNAQIGIQTSSMPIQEPKAPQNETSQATDSDVVMDDGTVVPF